MYGLFCVKNLAKLGDGLDKSPTVMVGDNTKQNKKLGKNSRRDQNKKSIECTHCLCQENKKRIVCTDCFV